MAKNCFMVAAGAEVAMTARLNVHKKNAIASISKEVLLISLMNIETPHIKIVSIKNESSTVKGNFFPVDAMSCMQVKI